MVVGQVEQLFAKGDIEVAHPARAKSLLSGSETDMLGGNGDVDVAMGLVVATAHPLLVVANATHDVDRCFGKPFAVVALAEGCLAFG